MSSVSNSRAVRFSASVCLCRSVCACLRVSVSLPACLPKPDTRAHPLLKLSSLSRSFSRATYSFGSTTRDPNVENYPEAGIPCPKHQIYLPYPPPGIEMPALLALAACLSPALLRYLGPCCPCSPETVLDTLEVPGKGNVCTGAQQTLSSTHSLYGHQ